MTPSPCDTIHYDQGIGVFLNLIISNVIINTILCNLVSVIADPWM